MADHLIEAISITDDDYIVIKFETSLRRASITDQRFKLFKKNEDETLTEVSDSFYPIDVETDWKSLSKILKLHFKPAALDNEQDYVLEISGLQNAIGTTLPTVNYAFTTDPSFTDDYSKPEEPEVIIEDHSIKSDVSISTDLSQTVVTGTPQGDFYVESVTPKNGSVYLTEDENNGVVEIRLSEAVDDSYLTSEFFKAQRKQIKRGPARWENLDTEIVQNTSNPIVYVRLPSADATPVFNTAGYTYFEEGYKYRVILSKHLGVAS